jgi:CDP-diglyceride synthetase
VAPFLCLSCDPFHRLELIDDRACYGPRQQSPHDVPETSMKPWHLSLIAIVIAVVAFVGWLVASYRQGRNGK